MPRRAQLASLPEAFEVIKEMRNGEGACWGEDVTAATRKAVAQVLEERMELAVDRHLAEIESRGGEDRRNGSYSRHLLGGLGDVELHVPRTRHFSAKGVVGAYARRTREVDRLILGCFVLGLSTRKVGTALLPLLGERVSASLVSQVAKTLDGAVAAFHQRPLHNGHRALLFDGVVLARKTGAGALRRPVLVVLGIRPDGRREVIDWRLAQSESEAEWQQFLTSLMQRGLTGAGVKIVGTDGGAGLLAALTVVFPSLPIQRCWAHKVRNITDKVRKADREAVKRSLRAIYAAENRPKARSAARRFADRWEAKYPAAVRCLQRDLDELLTFFCFKDPKWRKAVRTTNAIERRFREVRRRTRPMGVFSDRTSMDRILYAVFTHENQMQGVSPLFLVTQNS
jgi:transposase-like protein